jgi:uncharacterized membrane protein HdeD (DUF308 family)
MTATIADATRSGRWSTILAVLCIVIGVVAIGEPIVAGVAIALLVGWALIFNSIGHIGSAVEAGGAGRAVGQTLLAVVNFLGGLYFVTHPLMGLATLTLLLAIVLCAEAVIALMLWAVTRQLPGAGWRLLNAIVTVALAIMIWRRFPSSSVWVIGTLVGINLLMTGVSRLMMVGALRRIAG